MYSLLRCRFGSTVVRAGHWQNNPETPFTSPDETAPGPGTYYGEVRGGERDRVDSGAAKLRREWSVE